MPMKLLISHTLVENHINNMHFEFNHLCELRVHEAAIHFSGFVVSVSFTSSRPLAKSMQGISQCLNYIPNIYKTNMKKNIFAINSHVFFFSRVLIYVQVYLQACGDGFKLN